tara:strand:+ start:2065 stop:3129 length:1065 start_codon:yes stop_codon:yes gene_type:complete
VKEISLLLIALTVISCSKSSNDYSSAEITDPRMASSAITNIYATGKVSEQTAEQAKKTIFGKWNLGSSSNSSKSARETTDCTFNSVEFTEYDYNLNINAPGMIETGGIAVIYGNYELVEEGEKVTKVILKTITESGEQNIAEVTNIEVIETDGQLDISFKFDFIVNLESIGIPCNDNMDRDYSADKEPAVEGTLTADTDSNHYKIIGTWDLTDFSDSSGGTFGTYFEDCDEISDAIGEFVDSISDISDGLTSDELDFDTECITADAAKLVISTFGTYIYMALADENLVEVVMGNWEWTNEDQTAFKVTGGPGDALNSLAIVNSITDTQLSFTFTGVTYDDDPPVDQTYIFTKSN